MQSLGSIRKPLSPHREEHNIRAVKQGSTVPSPPGFAAVVGSVTSVNGASDVINGDVVVGGGVEVVFSVTRERNA